MFLLQISSRRGNWREQRGAGGNINRRGGGNHPKQNQYTSTNTRQQYNTRISRNNRFTNNQARDPPSMPTNEESTHIQRIHSSNFSQEQSADSTIVPARTIYPSANRSMTNQQSPVPYNDSSSSRTNSISMTSPPPNQQSATNKMIKKSSFSKNNEFLLV